MKVKMMKMLMLLLTILSDQLMVRAKLHLVLEHFGN